jgi:hypothetical protein
VRPFETAHAPGARGKIDELVFKRLDRLGIEPARPCSDEVFLRRAYLDVIGTLPTAAEAGRFLDDQAPGKRRKLIDRLLKREEFADYWSMKWCDLLRVKAEFPINLWPNAVQAYHRWIRTNLGQNTPFDRFARELLTSSGSNFRVPQVNFYRSTQGTEPEALAAAVALAFMGARFEKLSDKQRAGMTAFFSQVGFKRTAEWKEEIVFHDPRPRWPRRRPTRLGGDGPVKIAAGGTAAVKFRVPGRHVPRGILLELTDPPEGISMQNASHVEGGINLTLQTEAGMEAGLKGNLIVSAYREYIPRGKDGKPGGRKKRRSPMGVLPAIPFEIVKK